MTTHSHTQAILLKQLGIVSLSAKTELFARLESQLSAASKAAATATEYGSEITANTRRELIPSTRLADDIKAILQQTTLSDWQVDSLASHCQISEQLLITPPLALLQRPQLKRQLWQLLTEQFHD